MGVIKIKPARVEDLRRMPDNVRYFFLAVSSKTLHTGLSWGGLNYVLKKYGIEQLYIADVVSGVVYKITEPVEDFMARWRANYNDPEWDYLRSIEAGEPVPVFDS